MFKRLFVLCLMITTLFGQDEFEEVKQLRELTSDNFSRATARNIVVVEFYATWNETNKVTILDTWDTFDAKVYRINIDLYPDIQSNNNVVILFLFRRKVCFVTGVTIWKNVLQKIKKILLEKLTKDFLFPPFFYHR